MKTFRLIVEGKEDVTFFRTLLNLEDKQITHLKKDAPLQEVKELFEPTPYPIIRVVDADFTSVNTGYIRTEEKLSKIQEELSQYPFYYYIVSPQENQDGILEDLILDTIADHNNSLTIPCHNPFFQLYQCQKDLRSRQELSGYSNSLKALVGYYCKCYTKSTTGDLVNEGELLKEIQSKSPRIQTIRQEIQVIIDSILSKPENI